MATVDCGMKVDDSSFGGFDLKRSQKQQIKLPMMSVVWHTTTTDVMRMLAWQC